jgi:hypothetical protein
MTGKILHLTLTTLREKKHSLTAHFTNSVARERERHTLSVSVSVSLSSERRRRVVQREI